ncbi:hypothetical protein ACLOJK_005976 [Asimina triloba]
MKTDVETVPQIDARAAPLIDIVIAPLSVATTRALAIGMIRVPTAVEITRRVNSPLPTASPTTCRSTLSESSFSCRSEPIVNLNPIPQDYLHHPDNTTTGDFLMMQQRTYAKELIHLDNGLAKRLKQCVPLTFTNDDSKNVDFLAVDVPSVYNVIIDKVALNRFHATLSTYHLCMKFPTKYEEDVIHRDEMIAHTCYLTFLQ